MAQMSEHFVEQIDLCEFFVFDECSLLEVSAIKTNCQENISNCPDQDIQPSVHSVVHGPFTKWRQGPAARAGGPAHCAGRRPGRHGGDVSTRDDTNNITRGVVTREG